MYARLVNPLLRALYKKLTCSELVSLLFFRKKCLPKLFISGVSLGIQTGLALKPHALLPLDICHIEMNVSELCLHT